MKINSDRVCYKLSGGDYMSYAKNPSGVPRISMKGPGKRVGID